MGVFSRDEIDSFIVNYDSERDNPMICFDWNGKHAEAFEDRNDEFRNEVLEVVMEDVSTAPLELVRDLYVAVTEQSAEAWCIYRHVGLLGEQMLRRGNGRYIYDYVLGKGQSFDAILATSHFTRDIELVDTLIEQATVRLESTTDEFEKDLMTRAIEIFGNWKINLENPRPTHSVSAQPRGCLGSFGRLFRRRNAE